MELMEKIIDKIIELKEEKIEVFRFISMYTNVRGYVTKISMSYSKIIELNSQIKVLREAMR